MRLMQTPTIRNTLKILGMRDACREIISTESIPKDIQEIIEISPIPRNMHPKIHKARRKARSGAHERYVAGRKDVLYVYATAYKEHSRAVVSVVDHQLREINCASIKGNNILEAEEAAIALAITQHGEEATTEILKGSQEACRRYSSGRISTVAIRILKTRKITFSRCFITWTPDHETVTGNQRADANARAYANRETYHDGELDTVTRRYGAILENQRALRRIYPPSHKDVRQLRDRRHLDKSASRAMAAGALVPRTPSSTLGSTILRTLPRTSHLARPLASFTPGARNCSPPGSNTARARLVPPCSCTRSLLHGAWVAAPIF
ncbi:hypothetical protein HPB49_007492 [Dermacentor silvarum]|uniref:Uncharacterized protein n=1 Tax=Dermacentor silvarum TaxID=543639 RepID=A0ACB8CW57_DERSI|nr:hypothetical protein HPB49_007492 [Dermacentor silvarum]